MNLKRFVGSDMILQSSGAIGTQRWYVSAYAMANQIPVGLLFLAEDWSCCCGTTLGPPVFPLAFARASALSWPQDLDLAGPRYRRQAVCFSRTSEDTTRGRNREHVSFNQKSSCLHLFVLNACLWTQTEAQCTHTLDGGSVLDWLFRLQWKHFLWGTKHRYTTPKRLLIHCHNRACGPSGPLTRGVFQRLVSALAAPVELLRFFFFLFSWACCFFIGTRCSATFILACSTASQWKFLGAFCK